MPGMHPELCRVCRCTARDFSSYADSRTPLPTDQGTDTRRVWRPDSSTWTLDGQ